MAANQPPRDAIIIGIDFGTTFSGVAWSYSRESDNIEIVTSWDAELHSCSDKDKAPSQLYFDEKNMEVKWGYSVPLNAEPLKWFKLFLLDGQDLPAEVASSTHLQEARRIQNETKKSSGNIISAFLRKLWNHSMESIQDALGSDVVEQSRLHVIITMPAIWPAYAQSRMKVTAQSSGILDSRPAGATTLRFITEPEAAALATLKDVAKRSTIQAEDTIVVCDAGGGTVDIISYVFESTDPCSVKECVKGDGDLCRALFLDEGFVELVKTKIPDGTWDMVKKSDEKKFLNDQWEHGIKHQFTNQQKLWLVDLPEICNKSSSKGLKSRTTLEFTSGEILSVFSPIVSKIEALVNRQVDVIQQKYGKAPKYIILVGGFGRSRYLLNRLRDRFTSTVLQSRGTKPWTAICRGAVIQGLIQQGLTTTLGMTIASRVARMSYGVKYCTPFIEGRRDARDKFWDEKTLEYKADNQMEWFLVEGDNISSKRSVHYNLRRLYPKSSKGFERVQSTIFCATGFPPPRVHRASGTIQQLCTIVWNRQINTNTLPRFTNRNGESFPRLEQRIQMECEDGTVNFAVYHKNERVGDHDVEVQFD
ncbi:uncharacterized protein B0J16DRAFT_377627 [Fusarium flagelliforme]|uniref:Hsp70 protein n=1 Tax=Fusarium flagelliforme TaxID=2675880 RepID=A0A395M9R7_9HYPO|nr:uncharacterized protein B0J16DRAFT_377627 [Fusarium flagelliforme]KAH7197175.1 hypothetical protein B0J16DRAFT_377627 [Fusarium flagelliforme]RFN44570.1 hypothetical protein FIE12Z_11190 [Fusarium flagelliforme]